MAGSNAGLSPKSFSATLLAVSQDETGWVECSPDNGLAQGGWLVHRAQAHSPLALCFDYVSEGQGRLHYNISAGPETPGYAGAKLGVSANGFVGLYQVAGVSDFWKVQVIAAGAEPGSFDFILRDHRGHVVRSQAKHFRQGSFWTGSTHLSPLLQHNYLSIEAGKPIVFRASTLD